MPTLVQPMACRLDPRDPRDFDWSLLKIRLLAAANLGTLKTGVESDGQLELPERTPLSNQGPRPTCTANAACDALELIMPDPVVQLSRLFAYWCARRTHGEERIDDGSYLRAVFACFGKLGCAPEDLWPYDERSEVDGGAVNDQPPLCAFEAAYDHRLQGYFKILTSGVQCADEVEASLRLGHPTVLSMLVGQSFCDFDGSGDVVWNAPARPVGRHAMVVVGMRRNKSGVRHFKLRNSWGPGWGEMGYAWATDGWIADPTTNDRWVPTVVPAFAA